MASAARSTEWARRGGGLITGAEQRFGDSFRAFSDNKGMKGGWTRRD